MCVDETFGASQGCLCVYEKMSGEYLAFRFVAATAAAHTSMIVRAYQQATINIIEK